MTRNPVCFFLMFCGFVTTALRAEVVHVPATDSAISYVGRWGAVEKAGQSSMVTVNGSSQIYLTFTGQNVSGLFDLDGIDCLEQVDVRVDGGSWHLFTIDRPRIQFFPTGLSGGRHRLEVAVKAVDSKAGRWLPPLRSAVVFRGFEIDSGAPLEGDSPSKHRPVMQFIGDSITQGDGILHPNSTAVVNSDALSSYAWLAGEALGTTHAQIAFAGQGVISSDSREVPPAMLSFAWNFTGSAADFSRAPDFLVINLGSNDESASSNEFVQAYIALLQEIRRHCPQTVLFALRPFHGDRYHGDDVAQAVKMMADPGAHYVDSTGWLDDGDFTDGTHPNIRGSRKAAARLEVVLKPYVSNWKPKHE
jgi:lysophospholipase L1-like esterase